MKQIINGLSDGDEVLKYGTNPLNPDTDGDMLVDGWETNFNENKPSWNYVSKYKDIYDALNNTWGEGNTMWGEMEFGTNPKNWDTDGDGIFDGYEVQNLSMLKIKAVLWSDILHSKDYDDDSLPDGYEIRMAYYTNKYDPQNWTAGRYLNVSNATDASLDFDSDSLTNLEEYQRDPSGDYDHDGTPHIYDDRDDNDGIPTGVELQNHLDPFNSADAAGDLDSDGLSNLWEYENGTAITDPDTDHDGINDGDEYHYWQNYLHSHWNTWENNI